MRELDSLVGKMLLSARIPGAALAIVTADGNILTKAYGCSNLRTAKAVTADTAYPIASTSKAINALLLAMLVEEGRLSWDTSVSSYCPQLQFSDRLTTLQVTLRDLVTMRTGLPRHDWMWIGSPCNREQLALRLRHLELSGGFRERFQYNNLTVTLAGHIAELVTGRTWEDLVQERILDPLGMTSTKSRPPHSGDVTASYHENEQRQLVPTQPLVTQLSAPSGGSIYSSVSDMARWVLFNLGDDRVAGRPLVKADTLRQMHSPQVTTANDSAAPTTHACYGLGWFVDTYHGRRRVSHSGYIHDVNSDVSLFPEEGIGVVSWTNFGPPLLARLINQVTCDLLCARPPQQSVDGWLEIYEAKVTAETKRRAGTVRVSQAAPSHGLTEYDGSYEHPGYGALEVRHCNNGLTLRFRSLELPLEHWHYDAWIVQHNDLGAVHAPHVFDSTNRLLFETRADGAIGAVSFSLEPAVAPIRFVKREPVIT